MFGLGRGVTMGQAGWLWADLLLGLFAIFALANTVGGPPLVLSPPAPSVAPGAALASPPTVGGSAGAPLAPAAAPSRPPGVDPAPLELTLAMNGAALLSPDVRVAEAEQRRIATEAMARVGDRRVALVLAYGSHADIRTGDRLAELATAGLHSGVFEGAAVRSFHNQVAGDRGTTLQLSVYLYQR